MKQKTHLSTSDSEYLGLWLILPLVSLILAMSSCRISAPDQDGWGPQQLIENPEVNPKLKETGAFQAFITSVYQAPADEKQTLVNDFMYWADSTTGIPYIEDSTAYFLVLNGSSVTVQVAGDFSDWNPSSQDFIQLSGTNLYYRAFSFEADARLDYKLIVNGNWILDPLNPHTCSGGFGPNSELSMPAYQQAPEIEFYAIPHGTLSSTSFSDTTQGRTRLVQVYTPPGYSEGTLNYRSIYFHDGSEHLSLGFSRNVLDYLISEALIPPVIAIFVDPTNRNDEYSYDDDFMEMFVNELVPWIDDQYRTMSAAENRAIAGVSLGGLSSLLFTIRYSDVFGNCAAFSPAVWMGDLTEQVEASPVLAVKIYMDAGTYEPSIYNSSVALLEILENHQWDVQWKQWHEGHSWGAWRAHLDDALTYFWPMVTSGIDE